MASRPKLRPAPANTPPQTYPGPQGGLSVMQVAIAAIQEVSTLERIMKEEQWLPTAWLAKHGSTVRDRRDAMVLLHRGWNAVIETTIVKSGDLTTLQTALIELAAAAIKVASDVDRYKVGTTALAADVDCPACGLIPAVTDGTTKVTTEEDDEDE